MYKDAFELPHDHHSDGLRSLALKLLLPVPGSSEDGLQERVTLILVSEHRLDSERVAATLRAAYVKHGHVRTKAPANAPILSERMQRWSWRMAVDGVRSAQARALHTAQTEVWLNDDEGTNRPVLCQIFARDARKIPELLNAANALTSIATDGRSNLL
ncbi:MULTISPECIES: hypothetical protein [unclassified Paraburkholderia]|uniref:hypothetical protein n=1 Tax=unclassified Paraburkholderia TaxID=2615204 RepID=UPI002AAFA2A5|nr:MULTISPECIES: hypothetical protein [unclassified Paraburkholderia]